MTYYEWDMDKFVQMRERKRRTSLTLAILVVIGLAWMMS